MPDYTLRRPVINGRQSDTWYVCWSAGRRSHRRSTGTSERRAAEKFLAQFEAYTNAPPETFTVRDLCDAYLKEREEDPTVKYPKAIANSLRHIKAGFGDLTPDLVTRLAVRAYTTRRRKAGLMDSTIDKELRFLRQALKFGVREKWMADEPYIPTPGQGAARQRFMTRSEFAAMFFHAAPLHLRVFLALAVSTCARGKAIMALTWDRVDFERGIVWYVPHDPRSRKRAVQAPMNDPLRSVLAVAQRAAETAYVVEWRGERVKSVRKAYERAVALSGVPDAHRHDLRRTGASWAIEAGSSFSEVAALLGDTEEITRKHYAMFSPTYLRGVVDNIAGKARA